MKAKKLTLDNSAYRSKNCRNSLTHSKYFDVRIWDDIRMQISHSNCPDAPSAITQEPDPFSIQDEFFRSDIINSYLAQKNFHLNPIVLPKRSLSLHTQGCLKLPIFESYDLLKLHSYRHHLPRRKITVPSFAKATNLECGSGLMPLRTL